jgi:hypothetical protein
LLVQAAARMAFLTDWGSETGRKNAFGYR